MAPADISQNTSPRRGSKGYVAVTYEALHPVAPAVQFMKLRHFVPVQPVIPVVRDAVNCPVESAGGQVPFGFPSPVTFK